MSISSLLNTLKVAISPANTADEKLKKDQSIQQLKALYDQANKRLVRVDPYLNLAAANPQLNPYVVPLQQLVKLPGELTHTAKLVSELKKSSLDLAVIKKVISLVNNTLNLYVVIATNLSIKVCRKTQIANLSVFSLVHLLRLTAKLKDTTATSMTQAVAAYNSIKALLALCFFTARQPIPKPIEVSLSLLDIAIAQNK